MARPKLDIDPVKVRKMASYGCTNNEIADVLGCSHDTITGRFKQELEAGRADGRTSLRKKQMEMALSGNAAMLIWLGKQMLGQSDKVNNTTSNETKITIDLTDGGPDNVDAAEIITKDVVN